MMGAEVSNARRQCRWGLILLVVGFVVMALNGSSVRAAVISNAQEHDSNMREPAVIGDLSVDRETSIAPEMAPIPGTATKRRELGEEGEMEEEDKEEVMAEWATPSVSSPTEDDGSVPTPGAIPVFDGDAGVVSATAIELQHTQEEDGRAEMGNAADDPGIDATSSDTGEGTLTDTHSSSSSSSSSSSVSQDNRDEFDASDGFVAEENNDGSSSDRTHVSSSTAGGSDDADDVNTAAANEVASTERGGGVGEEEDDDEREDEREDDNDRHQPERKQDQEDGEKATLERDTVNEESVRGVALLDGVAEQALAGGGDGADGGGIQAGNNADSDSDSDSDSRNPGVDVDKESFRDAAATTADSVPATTTESSDDIVDAAATASEGLLQPTGVVKQGSTEAQATLNARFDALERGSTAASRDDNNNEDAAGTDSGVDSRRAVSGRPAAGGGRQQATPDGLSSDSDAGEGLTRSGNTRGRKQGSRLRTGRGAGGESKGEVRENDGDRFGNGGGGDGDGSGATDDIIGHGGGIGFGRSSPEELVQRVKNVEAELLRKLLAEEDANSLLDIWVERAREYVLTQTVPPTDAECDFNWSRLRCEPKCTCGARLRFGDYTPGRTCRLLHHWETSPECESTWDPSDEPAVKRLASAAVWVLGSARRAYEARVAPPSDPECSFSLATRRCEPQARCRLKFRWGDLTLSNACRLVEEEKPATAIPRSPSYQY